MYRSFDLWLDLATMATRLKFNQIKINVLVIQHQMDDNTQDKSWTINDG